MARKKYLYSKAIVSIYYRNGKGYIWFHPLEGTAVRYHPDWSNELAVASCDIANKSKNETFELQVYPISRSPFDIPPAVWNDVIKRGFAKLRRL